MAYEYEQVNTDNLWPWAFIQNNSGRLVPPPHPRDMLECCLEEELSNELETYQIFEDLVLGCRLRSDKGELWELGIYSGECVLYAYRGEPDFETNEVYITRKSDGARVKPGEDNWVRGYYECCTPWEEDEFLKETFNQWGESR